MLKRKPGRIFIAFVISGVLNAILLAVDWATTPQRYPGSLLSRIVGFLFSLPGAFAGWLVPPGHDAVHILGAIVVLLVSSIVFYAAIAWVILTIWVRVRRKAPYQATERRNA